MITGVFDFLVLKPLIAIGEVLGLVVAPGVLTYLFSFWKKRKVPQLSPESPTRQPPEGVLATQTTVYQSRETVQPPLPEPSPEVAPTYFLKPELPVEIRLQEGAEKRGFSDGNRLGHSEEHMQTGISLEAENYSNDLDRSIGILQVYIWRLKSAIRQCGSAPSERKHDLELNLDIQEGRLSYWQKQRELVLWPQTDSDSRFMQLKVSYSSGYARGEKQFDSVAPWIL